MKITEKTKKCLTVGGGILICAGLAVAISLQFAKPSAGGQKMQKGFEPVEDIVVQPSSPDKKTTEEKEVIIKPNTKTVTSMETLQPTQTDQTNQSIQPEVTKPAEPEETAKTNPKQKPDGTKVEGQPTPVEHESVTVPEETLAAQGQPQAGDVQDGKTYLPGFGYIENSGENQENYAEDMYENGNKIGTMD